MCCACCCRMGHEAGESKSSTSSSWPSCSQRSATTPGGTCPAQVRPEQMHTSLTMGPWNLTHGACSGGLHHITTGLGLILRHERLRGPTLVERGEDRCVQQKRAAANVWGRLHSSGTEFTAVDKVQMVMRLSVYCCTKMAVCPCQSMAWQFNPLCAPLQQDNGLVNAKPMSWQSSNFSCCVVAATASEAAEPSGSRSAGMPESSCTQGDERTAEGQSEAGPKPPAHLAFSVRNATLLRAIPFCCEPLLPAHH